MPQDLLGGYFLDKAVPAVGGVGVFQLGHSTVCANGEPPIGLIPPIDAVSIGIAALSPLVHRPTEIPVDQAVAAAPTVLGEVVSSIQIQITG